MKSLNGACSSHGKAAFPAARSRRFGTFNRRIHASATSPDGRPWAPLSPVTIARRAKAGKNTDTILQVTRHLAGNIVAQVDAAGLRVGSPVEYAGVMQFGAAQGAFGRTSRGGPIPWGTIPARPFLGISETDETEIVAIARAWLGDGW